MTNNSKKSSFKDTGMVLSISKGMLMLTFSSPITEVQIPPEDALRIAEALASLAQQADDQNYVITYDVYDIRALENISEAHCFIAGAETPEEGRAEAQSFADRFGVVCLVKNWMIKTGDRQFTTVKEEIVEVIEPTGGVKGLVN